MIISATINEQIALLSTVKIDIRMSLPTVLVSVHCVFREIIQYAVEFFLYVAIDIVTKTSLRTAGNADEKRMIWFYESMALICLATTVYVFHHPPYLICCLIAITFLYTQLLDRVDFRYRWRQLTTNWDEFQLHKESMDQMQGMRPQQPYQSYQPSMSGASNWPPLSMIPSMSSATYNSSNHQRWQANPPCQSVTSTSSYRYPVCWPMKQPVGGYNGISSAAPLAPRLPILTRRPLHNVLPPSTGLLALCDSVLSSFGISRCENDTPPGLINQQQNLCFINCVLQCLARSPGLSDGLLADCSRSPHTILNVTASLLKQLTVVASTVVDNVEFRAAAASLPGSMISMPGCVQGQQDAAELLMWLLETLHDALNSPTHDLTISAEREQFDGVGGQQRAGSMTLNMLKFIYGGLTSERIDELKVMCRKEIADANGLDNHTYAEPIQRLSDLEWLAYKDANQSVVDALFTGQLVDAQHCVACNRISVSIQPFRTLSLPLCEARTHDGVVFLEDCFARFANVQHLRGVNGLRCSSCNVGMGNWQRSSPVDSPSMLVSPIEQPNARVRRQTGSRQQLDQYPDLASPIPKARDLFKSVSSHEERFRTSTPITASTFSSVKPSSQLTDGEHRTLLRQLPECLTVQLLRFSQSDGGETRKVTRPVSVPLTGLDMMHLLVDSILRREDITSIGTARFRYDLYALVTHHGADSGGITGGHYVAYAADPVTGAWYCFDDDRVTSVNIAYELKTRRMRENVYLLFYQRSPS